MTDQPAADAGQPSTDPAKPNQRLRRAARVATVQALYEMALTGHGQADALTYRRESRQTLDNDLLVELVQHTSSNNDAWDKTLIPHLSANWTWDRLPLLLRVILRAALCEMTMAVTPPRVVINEYVNLTKQFFEVDEPKFVNAVLDRCYKQQVANGVLQE
ncbi:MAG: transcription antitermination factor NusB [Alphaproteobacteria bacterium]|nr:transcription antitermination factor NusB [Alphaproteobacteria bacterium]